MMVIVVIACIKGSCGSYIVSEPLNLAECMIQSQRAAAMWAITHPKHEVSAVVCTHQSTLGTEL